MTRRAVVTLAAVALGAGVFVSGAKAASPICGSKACSEEIAAGCAGLSGAALKACKSSILDQCKRGTCTCTMQPGLPTCTPPTTTTTSTSTSSTVTTTTSTTTTTATTPPAACCTQSMPGGPFDLCSFPVSLDACLQAGGLFAFGRTCTPNPCETTTTSTISTSTTSTTTSTTTTTTQVGGAFLEFTTGTPGGTCGDIRNGSNAVIRNLTCGGLNIGGGQYGIIPEAPIPDGSTSLFALTCAVGGGACDGSCSGSVCNIGPTSTAPPVNSAGPDCTDVGCNFGTPLPIPSPALPTFSTCALNTLSAPASGTLDLISGTSSTNVALNSDVYLTDNVTQPCPRCVAGVCDRGPRAGMACTSTSSTGYTRDCPTGGVGTPTSLCPGGGGQPGNGQTCCSPLCAGDGATPCSPANGDADCTAGGTTGPCVSPGHCINTPATACTSDADCGGAVGSCVPCNCPCTAGGGACCDGSHVGVIAINLSPLTTGTASDTDPGGLFCPGQTATQHGCFGSTACRTINESGVAAGPIFTGVPADATLASVFCIPATGVLIFDTTFGLPGPGALSLPGTFLVHN